MKQIGCIFLFIISFLRSDSEKLAVQHMIVEYNGSTTEGFVDSIGYQFVYFVPKDSVDMDSMALKDIYYAYNDFNRVFHYSWSFEENVRRMENRTGTVFTIQGDTLEFIDIQFNMDMINPEILVKTGVDHSELVSLLQIEKIETDFSILDYSVRKGFFYSFYSFLLASTFDIMRHWDNERRAVPQIWDQYNDLFPMISIVGMRETGVTYESFTSLIPLSVLASMVYDVIRDKNKFYFTPVYEKRKFGRNMYVFSLKHILHTQTNTLIFKIERTKLGGKVIGWIRKKV